VFFGASLSAIACAFTLIVNTIRVIRVINFFILSGIVFVDIIFSLPDAIESIKVVDKSGTS
jgi:hypothetical protein